MEGMKVRHTTRCAGGCARVLTVGARAERRHRTLWCWSCYVRHRDRCTACQERDAVPAREPVLVGQPGLW